MLVDIANFSLGSKEGFPLTIIVKLPRISTDKYIYIFTNVFLNFSSKFFSISIRDSGFCIKLLNSFWEFGLMKYTDLSVSKFK